MSALAKQTYADFDVLIVDNGSSDGSRERIEAYENGAGAFPEGVGIKGLFLPENTGFSGAVNAGIAAARGEYIILLNNDTEAEPDYIRRLCEMLDADREERIFAVSPRMVQLFCRGLLDDAGDGYNLLGWAFQRGVGQPVGRAKFRTRRQVFSACAGAAIYRKSILEKLVLPEARTQRPAGADGKTGGKTSGFGQTSYACLAGVPEYFDLQHFAYLEDIDLCYRARRYGYEVWYCPEAVVYHVGSGTSGSRYNAFKVRLAARNNVFLNYKNMPFLQLLLNLPGIFLGVLIKQLFFLKKGFGKAYFEGFLEGVRGLPSCRKLPFSPAQLWNCIAIEFRLLSDTLSYAGDFFYRHTAGAAACRDGRKDGGRNEKDEAQN